jgi:uncharacterized membrane protein
VGRNQRAVGKWGSRRFAALVIHFMNMPRLPETENNCPSPTTHFRAEAVYLSLLLLSLSWLGAIIAAPYLMANKHLTSSLILYQCFSAFCHQLPERSFHYLGYPLAVCSRCAAIYGGFVAGLLFYPLLRKIRNGKFPARWWLVAAAIPTILDFIAGYTNLSNTFSSRALTGLIFGSVAAFFILPGIIATFHADDTGISPIPSRAPHGGESL